MPEYSDIFEEIRDKVSLVDEMESRGIDLLSGGRDKLKCKCPLPGHDDGTPSFYITINNVPELFYCFGCRRNGSVIDFVMHYGDGGGRELTLKKTVEYLSNKYGISTDELDIDRLKNVPDKYKKNEPPIFSKSLLISEDIRNFIKKSINIGSDFKNIIPYMKQIDESLFSKDYPSINVFEELICDSLKDIRKNDKIYNLNNECKKCDLCDMRKNCLEPVLGEGNYNSKVLIVNDFPDNKNNFLLDVIKLNKFKMSSVWISYCMCCESDDSVSYEEISFCSDNYLKKQIEYIKPSHLMVLGERVKNVILPDLKSKSTKDLWGEEIDVNVYGVDTKAIFNINPRLVHLTGGFKSKHYDKFLSILERAWKQGENNV